MAVSGRATATGVPVGRWGGSTYHLLTATAPRTLVIANSPATPDCLQSRPDIVRVAPTCFRLVQPAVDWIRTVLLIKLAVHTAGKFDTVLRHSVQQGGTTAVIPASWAGLRPTAIVSKWGR